MAALSGVMGTVYQDTFVMRDCDNVADTTGVMIREGLEKVAHINRAIEKLNLTKFGTTCGGSLKKNLNVSRPSEHPPVRGENVKTFRWDHGLQRQNLLMAFDRVPLW